MLVAARPEEASMSDRHTISPYPIRMPSDLRSRLEERARKGARSLHAEIIARLEETLAIEEALETVAPGAPIAGTAGLLLDMHSQLAERQADAHDSAVALHADEIERYLQSSSTRLAELTEQLRAMQAILKPGE